jgi:hypothetical protein
MEIEKLLKDSKLVESLEEHDGIKILLEDLAAMVETINHKLLYSSDLSELSRKVLIAERKAYEWIAQRIASAKDIKDKYEQTGTTN